MNQSDLDRGIINVGNMYRFHKVLEKLSQGTEVTIAFLGGSITQDCNATKHELCYAFRTYDWFRRKFPSVKINYVNAGIGGTTSQFGVARVDDDVLSFNPDIVFIEFSVNDENNEKFMESYESLIRRVILSDSEPAVFTFNNVQYDCGINAQEVHNKIAVYYDLPVVSMKDSIYYEILRGTFASADITTDNLHPNDVGHGLLADVICNLLDKIFNAYVSGNSDKIPYKVPETTCTNVGYYNSRRFKNEISTFDSYNSLDVTIDNNEQYGVRDCFKKGIIFNSQNAFIELKLMFKSLSVQYLKTKGKNSPLAAIYIDGKKISELDGNFDEDWENLYLHDICSFTDEKEHDIRVEIENYPENSKQGFYLVSLITS